MVTDVFDGHTEHWVQLGNVEAMWGGRLPDQEVRTPTGKKGRPCAFFRMVDWLLPFDSQQQACISCDLYLSNSLPAAASMFFNRSPRHGFLAFISLDPFVSA